MESRTGRSKQSKLRISQFEEDALPGLLSYKSAQNSS
jgi:hypothetical protein